MNEPVAVLEIQHLSAGYGGSPVIRDVSLVVKEREVVALLGPNGAGKTTTLMTVSGMVRATHGRVSVVGRAAPKLRKAHLLARWGVMHVPESRGVFFGLTVHENLMLAGHRGRVDIEAALTYFPQLHSLLHRRAGLCSGGEQQMIALGRALISRPRLLMIDEMSLGLAPMIFEELIRVVRRAADETNLGVLLVEQYVDVALRNANRAYVLNHGEVVLEGEAGDLLSDRRRLDAAYLGTRDRPSVGSRPTPPAS